MAGIFFRAAGALLVLSAAIPALAGVKEGVEKWQAGDYNAAVVEWLPQAAKGDPDALFNLGQAYKLGRGVPLDKVKAEDFYRRAADKGHAPAQSNLGILLAQRGEKAEAAELWKKAAEKKDARAQYMLGVLHFNGDTVEKNWPLAYAYMLQAKNAGLPQAERALSTMEANMPQADRDRGTQMAGASAAADRLSSSGKPLPAARKTITDSVAANHVVAPAVKVQTQSSLRPSVTDNPSPSIAAKPVKLAGAAAPQPKSVVSAANIPVGGVAASKSGKWRIQLGAFSKEARAREVWTALQREHAALVAGVEPFYVAGGNFVRLQIGGFTGSAEANARCRDIKATGQACFAIEAN